MLNIGPVEVASSYQFGAVCLNKSGRDILKHSEGLIFFSGVGPAFGDDDVPTGLQTFHGHFTCEADTGDAGNRGEFIGNIILDSGDVLRLRDERGRNGNSHDLEMLGVGEAGSNISERLKSADH